MRLPHIGLAYFILMQWIFGQIVYASRSPGETSPQRVEIKVGGSANITCSMNLQMFSGKNSSSLYFVQEDTGIKVSNEDIAILNITSVVYMIRNASSQNRGYVCKSGVNAIGITKVSVGTEPLNVVDFQCRAYDYEFMVCNFTIPKNMILTQYNLSYTTHSPNYLQKCDLQIQDTHGVCNLTKETIKYRRDYEFYNFTLTGHNSLGTNRQIFWINHYDNVIPSRPEFHIVNLTDTSAELSYNFFNYGRYSGKGLQYEIKLQAENFDWVEYTDYEIRTTRMEMKLKLRKLPYAYYWYTLSVRMKVKSARNDGTMWSEPFTTVFRTNSRLPEFPPLPDVGSFYIGSTETDLRIYWKQVPRFYENGPNFHYVIRQIKRDDKEIELEPTYSNHTSVTILWDKKQHYEFSLKSKNEVGESTESKQLTVYPMEHSKRRTPKWIRNIYHASNRTYTLSWSPPTDQTNLVDYTVFWCQSKREVLNECNGTISFQHISKNTTKFTTAYLKEEQTLNLAVSANYIDYNSGMHWTMRPAEFKSDLVKLEPEVLTAGERSVKVEWNPDHEYTSLLEGYNLTYCRVANDINVLPELRECLENNKTITIDKTHKKYILTNLKPYSTYRIEMYMFSKSKRGKKSDPIFIKTKEEAPTPPRNLKFWNVTSNSAWISWMPPTQLNGILRHYTIIQNNEHHVVNCSTETSKNICTNDIEKEITFHLENLSSYTNYKVYVIAFTIDASDPSNDIHFKTLIGMPSNPRRMIPSESNNSIIQWSMPDVPSGRVEFYEVAVIEWHRNKIHRQRISGVVGATSCTINIPVCPDPNYKHTMQVRAVNVVSRDSEVDDTVFDSNKTDFDDSYYEKNDDLKCVGSALRDEEQDAVLQQYRNDSRYKLYKSVWEKGPIYVCAAIKSEVFLLTAIGLTVLLGVVAAFGFARNKYNKMANISCALPPELDPRKSCVDKDMISKEEETRGRSVVDSLYSNEKHHLLSSISNDSGYLGGVNGAETSSIGRNSGYVGSERSDEYKQHNKHFAKAKESDTDSYVVMKVLNKSEEAVNKPELTSYVKPNIDNSHIILKTDEPVIPSTNGYIKPNKMFNWHSEVSGQDKSVSSDGPGISLSSNGYVQPQMLQNKVLQTPFDGYTTLDALGKPTVSSTTQPPTSPQTLSAPSSAAAPISGYVTQKELSAFAQQRIS